MILMHYFNRTYFENETKQWPLISLIFKIEICVIVFNILHTVLFYWINIKAKQFHKNWTNIMSILYVQHIIADTAWVGQRALLIRENYTDPFDSEIFIVLSYIRACCLFSGLSILPCLIIERYYATIHFIDYESKSKVHISYILLVVLLIIGNVTSFSYHKYESSISIFTFVMVFCSLGILGNIILLRINIKYFNELGKLSLRARYQIAENIKVCRLVNGTVFSMGGFNGLICFTIILDHLNLSMYAASLSVFAFDVSAIITVFPYVCMHYCNKWKSTFIKLFGKFFPQRRFVQPYTTPESGIIRGGVVLRNTFGQVMTNVSSDIYFQQLQQCWG